MNYFKSELDSLRTTQLMILGAHTFFSVLLFSEDLFLGWESWVVPLIALQLIFCWYLHLMQSYDANVRLHIYALLEMIMFFFYGIHATSFNDLAPVMIIVLLLYTMAAIPEVIWVSMIVYYLTALFDLLFVPETRPPMTTLGITRIVLHFSMILLGGLISRMIIKKGWLAVQEFLGKINDLEETNRRTEEFLTNVSHELRTPINAVIGISSVMIKNDMEPEQKQNLTAVREAGQRLFDQIEDILDHTELRTGRLTVQNENYMISSLIGDLYTDFRTSHRTRVGELILDVDPRLPTLLNGDVRKIKKIMHHLIANSLKFTDQGCVLVRLRGIPKAYGLNLFIEVTDTGIGIEENEIDRITEQFYQTMGGKSKSVGGLGLGLPIVHGLATAMNGFFQIKSVRGRGTTALVSIPQTIIDKTPCMHLEHSEEISAVFYDRPNSYADSRIRDYYNETVLALAQGLGVPLSFATTLDGVMDRVSHGAATHLFTGWAEYHKAEDYFDTIKKKVRVIVGVDEDHATLVREGIHTISLPFNGFAITRELMSKKTIDHGTETFMNRQMICPYVRALVVDDEPMNLVVAKGIFKDYRLITETAGSGKEAIEKCQKSSYDLIFLDHMMPQMDGVETMHRLRKAHPGKTLKIIALTANAVSGAKDMFFAEGFDEFLAKPLEYPELERVLRRLLPDSSITYISAR